MSSSLAPSNQGRRSRDARAAREHAVGRVNDDLKPEPEERGPIVEVDDGAGREEREDDAAGRVEVNEPGADQQQS